LQLSLRLSKFKTNGLMKKQMDESARAINSAKKMSKNNKLGLGAFFVFSSILRFRNILITTAVI
ncbi:MAG: hypothetical protein VW836_04035, partial [Alphaproteobacteria bacterium]